MVAVAEHVSTYLDQFEQLAKGRSAEPDWLRESRQAGLRRFCEMGFPTTKHEEYKYTNLAPLARIPFRPPTAAAEVSAGQLAPAVFEQLGGSRLVFVNGHFSRGLSRIDPDGGVEAGGLRDAITGAGESLENHLTRYTEGRPNVFAAFNTAFFEDGAFVRVPDRAIVEAPIHLIFVSTAEKPDAVSNPRILILAGRDSQASVIETHIGLGGNAYWTNAVTEIAARENARLEHYRLQRESAQAFHTSFIEIRQGRDSNVVTHSLSLGGLLVRNDVEVVLEEEAAECTLNGLYAANGRQHIDNHTWIDHAKPHCTSHQLYKGVLDGHSTGVFNGMIIVRPDAQKTDAIQSNKNLLLSENATINTKPQLQIDANDVRCTHGATVGQIDEEAIFYLRSRGVGYAEARNLLTYAFAADILERIKIDPVRKHLEAELLNWLGEGQKGRSQEGGRS